MQAMLAVKIEVKTEHHEHLPLMQAVLPVKMEIHEHLPLKAIQNFLAIFGKHKFRFNGLDKVGSDFIVAQLDIDSHDLPPRSK